MQRSCQPVSVNVVTVVMCLRVFLQSLVLPGAAVFFGERINGLAGQHWQAFAGQDYFDSHGIFYSIMVSGPAVFNLFAVLVSSTLCEDPCMRYSTDRRRCSCAARAALCSKVVTQQLSMTVLFAWTTTCVTAGVCTHNTP
jgi:hypothetical protein